MAKNFYDYIQPPTWAGTPKPVVPPAGGGQSPAPRPPSSGGGGGGGGSRPAPPALPTVDIKGNEVIINGQGYSVIPGKMTEFLTSKGISGSSFQSTLDRAKQLDTDFNKQSTTARNILLTGLETKKNPTNALQLLKTNVAINTPQKLDFTRYTQPNQLVSTALKNIEKKNTVTILLDENNKANGIEYGGMSYNKKGFEDAFSVKLLYDPQKEEYFFGSASVMPDKKILSTFSGGFTPITQEELNQVQRALLRAKIKAVATGELGVIDAVTNTNVQKYIQDEKNWAINKITGAITSKSDKYAKIIKDQATLIMNDSDFKSGNKALDITGKTIGKILYIGGSAEATAIKMISGLSNKIIEFSLKPKETSVNMILSAPAMFKSAGGEINRTFRGTGTIEDFFGAALSLYAVGSLAAGVSRYRASLKNVKATGKFRQDLPVIKKAVNQLDKVLKTNQKALQKVIVKDSNNWETFGGGWQQMNKMNARHSWTAVSAGKKSTIIQTSAMDAVVDGSKVKIFNLMAAKSTASKINSIIRKVITPTKASLTFDYFKSSSKLQSYLSKVQTSRVATFVKVEGRPYMMAIDGRGYTKILYNKADLIKFMKNTRFGKFSFSGKRAVGGNIETIFSIDGKSFFGTGRTSILDYRPSDTFTKVQKAIEDQSVKSVKYFKGKSGSKAFRTIKERANSDYAWRKSVDNAVKNLEKWGKNNPEQVKSLVKDLNKVYNPKEISYKEWRASTQRAGKKLDTFVKNNPDKIRALIADSKKIYGNEMQQLAQVSKQVSLPKNIALSKGVSSSVVGSQLKSVTKAISKAITKNDLALKSGFRAVVAPSGLMFFSRTGKLVSAKEATESSNKVINKTIGAIKEILSEKAKQTSITRVSQSISQSSAQKSAQAVAQKSAQAVAQKSAQKSKQQQLQRLQQAMNRSTRTNFKFELKPLQPEFKLPSDDKKNKVIIKKILGNKLAPSYKIIIGSGKKVKALSGRYSPAEAISKGAFTIDRTKERTIRIIPTKQKPNSRFKMNYLRQANRKFRNYRIKQGKRVKYSSTRLIERSKYFNDLERLSRRRRK